MLRTAQNPQIFGPPEKITSLGLRIFFSSEVCSPSLTLPSFIERSQEECCPFHPLRRSLRTALSDAFGVPRACLTRFQIRQDLQDPPYLPKTPRSTSRAHLLPSTTIAVALDLAHIQHGLDVQNRPKQLCVFPCCMTPFVMSVWLPFSMVLQHTRQRNFAGSAHTCNPFQFSAQVRPQSNTKATALCAFSTSSPVHHVSSRRQTSLPGETQVWSATP